MRRVLLVLASSMAAGAWAPLGAQSVSVQVGVSTFDADHEPEIGVRVSPATKDVVGIDFSFDTYPRLLVIGALAGMADLSVAVRVRPLAAVSLVGRAGGSALLGLSGGGVISYTGYHAAAGIVVTADARTAVRLDYTYRRLQTVGESYTVPTFTFGFIVHP
jgi:hypothetical protein